MCYLSLASSPTFCRSSPPEHEDSFERDLRREMKKWASRFQPPHDSWETLMKQITQQDPPTRPSTTIEVL
jgi:hypothetical protein